CCSTSTSPASTASPPPSTCSARCSRPVRWVWTCSSSSAGSSSPTPTSTGWFVWARACRIWPAYAVAFHLFGIWVVARLVWGSDDQVAFQAVQPVVSLPEYLQQLVLVQLWDSPFFDGASWVGSTWSISAEWLAYLLFPVAALVFHRLRDLPVALLAAGSLALMTPIAWAYLLTGSPYHPWSWAVRVLCGFGAGVVAHLVVRRLQGSASARDGRASDRVRRW